MRLILGMVLGAMLVVLGAYAHDSMRTSTVASGPDAAASRPMVNWDVVQSNWSVVKRRAHDGWVELRARVDRS